MPTITPYVPTGSLTPVFSHLAHEASVFSAVGMYPEAAAIEGKLGGIYNEGRAYKLAGEAFQSQGEHLNKALIPSHQAFRQAITAFGTSGGCRDSLIKANRAFAEALLRRDPSYNLVMSAAEVLVGNGDLLQAAILYRSKGLPEMEQKLLKRAAGKKPKNLEDAQNIAIARYRIDNLGDAIETAKAIDDVVDRLISAELDVDAAPWLFFKGMFLEGAGEYLQAADAFDYSYEEFDEPYVLYRKGLALKNAGQSDETTRKTINNAIELFERSDEEYLLLLGEAYYRYGEVLFYGAKEFANAREAFKSSGDIFGDVAGNFGRKRFLGLRRSAREWQAEAKYMMRWAAAEARGVPFKDPAVRPSKGLGKSDDPPKKPRGNAPAFPMVD